LSGRARCCALLWSFSLRAGLATAAAAADAEDHSIQKQTGHKRRAILDRYIRSAELFKDNAAGIVASVALWLEISGHMSK
jgi:hypothetical protein